MRNIVNPEVVPPFIDKLKKRYPKIETFIDQNLRNYLLRSENTFIEKDEFMGGDLWFKKMRKEITPQEKSMLDKQGITGTYLKLNLNKEAFDYYCHKLDFANNFDPQTLLRMSVSDLKRQAVKAEKKAKEEVKTPFVQLQLGVDIRFVAKLREYNLFELLTLRAYQMEGQSMNHCVGTYVKPDRYYKMYSLRNRDNKGIMTVHVNTENLTVREARGKSNSRVDENLLSMVMAALGAKPESPEKLKKKLHNNVLFYLLIVSPFLCNVVMAIMNQKLSMSLAFTGMWAVVKWKDVYDAYKNYTLCVKQNEEYKARSTNKT